MTHAATRAAYYARNKHKWTDYQEKNADQIRERKRARYAAEPEKHRGWRLKSLFKMTAEDYRSMLEAQGGVCKICKGPEKTVDSRNGKLRCLAVDHNHKTGEVRGLLCSHCNRAIGLFQDEPELLLMAAEYLRGK